MIVDSIRVRNFRSIVDESLKFDDLTVLVGPNGCGKSTILKALQLFHAATPKLDEEDFYNRNVIEPIRITVTFRDLSPKAKERFGSYLQDGVLTVERVIEFARGKALAPYHGAKLLNPDFDEIRTQTGKKEKRKLYEDLRTNNEKYADLLPASNAEKVDEGMRNWEEAHPDKLERIADEIQFFGYQGVGRGYVNEFTTLVVVPAVRDAADDASEGKGSAVSQLIDILVRNALETRADYKQLVEQTKIRYTEILCAGCDNEMQQLHAQLNKTLRTFVPNAHLEIKLQPGEPSLPLPAADTRLSEDGFISEVSKTGHGLQRAFLLAILQYLASVQERRESLETASEESNAPDLVLAIEEPELYQHPNRQRHFARVLAELASAQIPGAARRIQVLYCTHSPLFVGIDRFNRIRLLKKIDGIESRPKTTKIVATNLESVARRLDEVGGHDGRRYTPETLLPQLRTIMNPWMNEGFFAQVVVLVEGETDRAAILGVANAYGHDFEQNGIAVVPCGGKNNIDRPAIIFSEFGIATYLVWDGDFEGNGARPSINRELLRLVRSIEVDWPEAVEPTFACFKRNLETTLRQELGDIFWDTKLSYYRAEYDFDKNKDALKNPVVIEKIIEDAHNSGKECVTLNNIVHHIWEMRSR